MLSSWQPDVAPCPAHESAAHQCLQARRRRSPEAPPVEETPGQEARRRGGRDGVAGVLDGAGRCANVTTIYAIDATVSAHR